MARDILKLLKHFDEGARLLQFFRGCIVWDEFESHRQQRVD